MGEMQCEGLLCQDSFLRVKMKLVAPVVKKRIIPRLHVFGGTLKVTQLLLETQATGN